MTQPDKSALLPCPFCGEAAAVLQSYEKDGKTYWRVRCDECWAQSHGSYHLSSAGAAKVWNTRASDGLRDIVTVGMVTAALASVGEHDVSLASQRRREVTKMIQAAIDWKPTALAATKDQ